MVWTPVFKSGKPYWYERNGVMVPSWSEDPCDEDCDVCEGSTSDPVLFTFCNCQLRGVRITLSGYRDESPFNIPGCTTSSTHGSFTPGCETEPEGLGSGCYMSDSLHNRYVECTYAAMNGTYSTASVTGDASAFSATINVGTSEDTGDPGIPVYYFRYDRYAQKCRPPSSGACTGDSLPFILGTWEEWWYLYQIQVTGSCQDCSPPEGGKRLSYSIGMSYQYYIRNQSFESPVCEEEGWGYFEPTCEGWAIPGMVDTPCHASPPGILGGGTKTGVGTCAAASECAVSGSGSTTATDCIGSTTISHTCEVIL